jgi:choline dehydrogenase-like flavoprotein
MTDRPAREWIVIGSGPGGVSAADALLRQGHRVRMVDAGGEPDADAQAAAARLGAREPEDWTRDMLESVRGPLRYNGEGMPLRLAFGSDHVYRDVERLQPVRARGVDAYRGFAVGGLSALWGAAVAEFTDADLDDWPIRHADLAPFYRETQELLGTAESGARELESHTGLPALAISPQARVIAERSRGAAAALAAAGLRVGVASLAVRQAASCRYCAMCLYGCPYGLIYSAGQTLRERLLRTPGFCYEPGVLVRRVARDGAGVVVHGAARDSGQPRTFRGARVFLAVGAIATTAILLESLGAAGSSLRFRQSDHALLPLWLSRDPGPVDVPAHTLSQLFVQVDDPEVSSRPVHLQLYTHNDHYDRVASDWLGPFARPAGPALRPFMRRLVLLKGYFHSDDSAAVRVVQPRSGDPRLDIDVMPGTPPGRGTRGLVRRLRAAGGHLGAWPIPLTARVGRPGSSVHLGGSFPMRREPGRHDTDELGRVPGLPGVHVVDAAAFPTLPAMPPTLTIMATPAASRRGRPS